MSQAGFVLYDDAQARATEPFAITRPFGEVRVGAMLIRERWERVLGAPATGFVAAPHLATFQEFDSPAATDGTIAAGTLIVNTRFAPALDAFVPRLNPGEAVVNNGRIAAVRTARAAAGPGTASGSTTLDSLSTTIVGDIAGWWLGETWDAVGLLPDMLATDASVLADQIEDEPPTHVSVLGPHRLAAARGSYFEPYVVVDTTNGDVVVEAGARIGAFTRLAGPCVIGAHAQVAGGRFSCVSIGAHSRACGEMSVVIMIGHANKGHDGFIGHSMIGRWANLGAGTITSNLKNSYGSVRVTTARGVHDTGMRFLGSLIGDHAKLAIGTRLMTGSIIGAGANVFGDRSPDQQVPPFAWGDRPPFTQYAIDKFLDVAAQVLQRRAEQLSEGMRSMLRSAHTLAGGTPPDAKPNEASTRRRQR